jgi:hypothetical protein
VNVANLVIKLEMVAVTSCVSLCWCRNIPASPAYGVFISQLTHYSRACTQYNVFLDRDQLLTQKLLNQGYVAPRLNSSLQKFYGRHHNLVDLAVIEVRKHLRKK